MARYTITPWRSQADLLAVRSQLYHLNSSDKTTPVDPRRHAVDRVMAWKLRGNLPHAVESTALLVDALLHHHATTAAQNSLFSVRAVYSAAFCRFVTGFCDIGRAREGRLEPSSMLDIARQINMPAEFVALRHEATHEELPSVQRLVVAARQGLDWLWRVYWSRLLEVESAEDVGDAALSRVKDEASKVLRSFRTLRRETLRNKKTQGRSEPETLVRDTCRTVVDLCGDDRFKVQAVAEVLVDDSLIFPSTRE